jgi:hypothetical protein
MDSLQCVDAYCMVCHSNSVQQGVMPPPPAPTSPPRVAPPHSHAHPQLLYLQLGAAGGASKEADHAASHVGKAVGLTTLLRGTRYHASHRRSYLPIDLCAQHGVSQVSRNCVIQIFKL